jgi:hypothetical protein
MRIYEIIHHLDIICDTEDHSVEEEFALKQAIDILCMVKQIAIGEEALKELKEYVRKTD